MDKRFNIHDWQAKQRLEEHHAGDYKPGFLKQTVSKFLDKLKKKNEADYNKVEKIMEKHFSAKKEVEEASTIGMGALGDPGSVNTGNSVAYPTKNIFKKKRKKD